MAGLLAWSVLVLLMAAGVATMIGCFLKGKWFVGMMAWPLLLTGIPVIAAVRVARPDSWWARHRYDEAAMVPSLARWQPRSPNRLVFEIASGVLLLLAFVSESTVVP